jgi:hypothetical protein
MKFNSWVSKQDKLDSNVRLVYDTIRSNHNFPNSSSLTSIKAYCIKNGIGNEVISAFTVMFNTFSELPYAQIYDRGMIRCKIEKKRLSY